MNDATDTSGGAETGEALPVAEAAAFLNVSERRLRRLLQRPEYAARTVAQTRRTRTGTRTGAALPPGLLDDLRAAVEHENNAANGGNENAAQTQAEADERGHERRHEHERNTDGAGFNAEAAAQVVPLYQRLLEEKDARIGDLKSEVEALRAALEREQQNHARTQALRALDAPRVPDVSAPAPDSPPDAPQGPQTGESGEVAAKAGPGGESVVEEQPRRGSWWPFGRKTSQ